MSRIFKLRDGTEIKFKDIKSQQEFCYIEDGKTSPYYRSITKTLWLNFKTNTLEIYACPKREEGSNYDCPIVVIHE